MFSRRLIRHQVRAVVLLSFFTWVDLVYIFMWDGGRWQGGDESLFPSFKPDIVNIIILTKYTMTVAIPTKGACQNVLHAFTNTRILRILLDKTFNIL
jgi:hypothetical protein